MRAIPALCAAFIGLAGQGDGPEPADLVRIREAFRLTEAVQDSVWPGGWGAVPYPLLLVTEEREFLMGFPDTPSGFVEGPRVEPFEGRILERPDRKSTRLNSSHVKISYAVFCLKKKKLTM